MERAPAVQMRRSRREPQSSDQGEDLGSLDQVKSHCKKTTVRKELARANVSPKGNQSTKGEFNFFSIPPQALNVVPSPLVGLEEVHHQVHKVQHNPGGVLVTAALPRGLALLAGMLLHEVGHRAHLAIRRTGDDKDPVHDLGKIANIQVQGGKTLTKSILQVAQGKTDISATPFILNFLIGLLVNISS